MSPQRENDWSPTNCFQSQLGSWQYYICKRWTTTRSLISISPWQHKRHIQSTTKYVELVIVADNREVNPPGPVVIVVVVVVSFGENAQRLTRRRPQFQKQGKDLEKVKQRLAEIANYVDKVTDQSAALGEGGCI